MRFLLFCLALLSSAPALAVRSIPVEFALVDSAQPDQKWQISVQGPRDFSTRYEIECERGGRRCDCTSSEFSDGRNPQKAVSISASGAFNTLYCTFSGGKEAQARANYIQLRSRSNASKSAWVELKRSLTLGEVLGSLDARDINKIYRYECARTFFEGEGVKEDTLSCLANQRLGVITASYSFYTFSGLNSGNSPGGDIPFSTEICGRNSFVRQKCSGSFPSLRYGLYGQPTAPFTMGVSLTRAPGKVQESDEPIAAVYGYAALPDSTGRCAPGLQAIRVWVAKPITLPWVNVPNNFMNRNGFLNSAVLEPEAPAPFEVARAANATPCSVSGDCSGATFHGPITALRANFEAEDIVVCAIPKDLLN